MKYGLTLIAFMLFVFCSCGQKADDLTFINSDKVALNLVQLCVDSTLRLDPGLNSEKYLVDFSIVKGINRQGIETFLKLNTDATEANLDSLFSRDTTWTKYQYFQNPVIRFDKIKVEVDGTILINTSKTKTSDGAIGTEIILQRQGDNFKCISSKITWIS